MFSWFDRLEIRKYSILCERSIEKVIAAFLHYLAIHANSFRSDHDCSERCPMSFLQMYEIFGVTSFDDCVPERMHVRRLTYVGQVDGPLRQFYGHVIDVFVGRIKDPTTFRPVATINSLKVNNLGGSGGQQKAEHYPARAGGKRLTLIVWVRAFDQKLHCRNCEHQKKDWISNQTQRMKLI